MIFDGRTLQSTCESGPRAGYDGYKRKKGSKVHIAIDALGHLLAVQVTPANEQERPQVRSLAQELQHVIGETVKIAFVDQGYTGQEPAQAARKKASSCMSSNCKKRKKALSCCRADG